MPDVIEKISTIDNKEQISKESVVEEFQKYMLDSGYTVSETNDKKPWGAYLCLDAKDAEKFVGEFFPTIDVDQAKLGKEDTPLSPKILIVSPGARLSWQYHNRRAECWSFITDGAYKSSVTDDESELKSVEAGEMVQFSAGERHRLVGLPDKYTIVAEIWQHTNHNQMSDEDDIVRLADDYSR